MIEVEAPDGSIVEFPVNTPIETINQAMRARFGGPQQPQRQEIRAGMPIEQASAQARKDLAGTVDMFASGVVGGLGPVLTGAEAAIMGKTTDGDWFNYDDTMGERYRAARDADRAQNDQFRADNPKIAMAAEVAGNVIGLGKAGKLATKLAPGVSARLGSTLGGRMAQGSMMGAGLGATTAAGEGDNIPVSMATGALAGAGGAYVGDKLAKGGSKLIGAFRGKPAVMSKVELEAAKKAAYARRDAVSKRVLYDGKKLRGLEKSIQNYLARRGYAPENQPGVAGVLNILKRTSKQKSATGEALVAMREAASGGWKPGNKKNNAMVREIIDQIDGFAAKPANAFGGPADQFAKHWDEGREYAHRLFKLQDVGDLAEMAGRRAGSTGSGGNVENATRQNLRKIMDNVRLRRGFKPDELDAIEELVMGTPTQNLMRRIGKLSPEGNGLMLALLGGTGASAASVGAPQITGAMAAMAGAGFGAKRISEAMLNRQTATVERIIRAGGEKAKAFLPENQVQQMINSPQVKRAVAKAILLMGVSSQGVQAQN